MSNFRLLFQIAMRNLFASFFNLIIGGVILAGTFFFVVGSSLLSNIDNAMSKSITGSVGGHVQIYSANSKDQMQLFSSWQVPDVAPMTDFSKIKKSLSEVENIKTIVPMGISNAFVAYGNSVDQILEKLRRTVNKKLKGDNSPETLEKIESLKSHVRQMVAIIAKGFENYNAITSGKAVDPRDVKAIEKAGSEAFWKNFNSDPLNSLEFLENNISSLVPDADFAYLGYVGTDLEGYSKAFDRMKIVDGTAVPAGKRGLLLAKFLYEKQFKMKTASRLDEIHEALTEGGKTIATNPDLQTLVKQNKAQISEIILQFDPIVTKVAIEKVQKFLKTEEKELPKLLTTFFDTTDENFEERYKYFYSDLAPLLELYRLVPGDTLTIKAYTKNGFMQSVNVKVYGTFDFAGLEKSSLAGGLSLMDIMSFRDLYGYLSPDKLEEMKAIKAAAGAKTVSRDNVEAELFGGSTTSLVRAATETRINEATELKDAQKVVKSDLSIDKVYTPEEIEQGVALNAAIILKDPSKMYETMKQIEDISKRDDLQIKVLTWQQAAGFIGQFVFLAKIVLYVAVFIIFVVALVIMNNAVMMATLQRVREIGTMRAIGAQRSFVLSMILVETVVLGAVFGLVGAILGSGVVKFLGVKGIPANNEFMYFFFSGPRLYTTLGITSIIGAFFIVVLVAALSALYPAIIATRVSPVQAMASEE